MRRILLLLFLCLIVGVPTFAQSTSVSGTITDSGSQAWAYGSYSFSFKPASNNPQGPYFWNGSAFNVAQVISGSLDSSGAFSGASVPSNTSITPSGSTWIVQVCPGATTACYQKELTITGASQDITASVVPPPVVLNLGNPPPGAAAYTDAEVIGAKPGSFYYNITSNTLHVCSITSFPPCTWQSLSSTGNANTWTQPQTFNAAMNANAGGVLNGTFTGNATFTGNNTHSGMETFANINKTVYVDQQAGATADVKFANACAALPSSGGILNATGFGAGTQSIAATVVCGGVTKPVEFSFDPSTVFQPASASLTMFEFSYFNYFSGLHIDTTNQATYSGIPIANNPAQGIQHAALDNIYINMASGSTGPCMSWSATSASVFVQFSSVSNFTCFAGTGATGIALSNSGGGWINGNQFGGLRIYNARYGVKVTQAGTAAISSNKFLGYEYEANSLATALSGVYFDATGHNGGNDLSYNQFTMTAWDLSGTNTGVAFSAGSANYTCGNEFSGQLIRISYSDGSCAPLNQFHDLFGNIGGQNVLGYTTIKSPATLTIGSGAAINSSGAGGTMAATVENATLRQQQFVADQGTACTNGELALSAGWQSTGSATVTGVLGTGQTCSWIITTGTTTAANPTVTDTLTNALPSANTKCWMIITGGTRTAAAGDAFDEPVLSATAPIFNFSGTPTAGGKTYFVTRTCGP